MSSRWTDAEAWRLAYVFIALICAALIWFGGMQYADRDNWTCAYAGGEWNMSVFERHDGVRVFVNSNYC